MALSSGRPELSIGLIDGPIDLTHPAFADSKIKTVNNFQYDRCMSADSISCTHGTFIAGILCAKRGLSAPAICPSCTIVLFPLFSESTKDKSNLLPFSTPADLSNAIIETIEAGARIINLSIGLLSSSSSKIPELEEVYEYARDKGVIIIASAGNQGNVGFFPLINNKWIIPVAACDSQGRPMTKSNFGPSIGKQGVMAPGMNIISTLPGGRYGQMSGTSVAAPFVSGTIALLYSLFPKATPEELIYAVVRGLDCNRRSIVPPLLNADAAIRMLKEMHHL